MTPEQTAFRRNILNYLQSIGFLLDEAVALLPKDPEKFHAFRMSFMVPEDRDFPEDKKELS